MSRGTIYHITTCLENVGTMDATDFYGHCEALGIDFVQDQEPVDARENVLNLAHRLEKAGFILGKTEFDNEEVLTILPMTEAFLKAAKSTWFQDRFEILKKRVGEMTLEAFSSDSQNEFELRSLIRDGYSDAVYSGNEYCEQTEALDDFIRQMTPDTEYFISGNTVYMH